MVKSGIAENNIATSSTSTPKVVNVFPGYIASSSKCIIIIIWLLLYPFIFRSALSSDSVALFVAC